MRSCNANKSKNIFAVVVTNDRTVLTEATRELHSFCVRICVCLIATPYPNTAEA